MTMPTILVALALVVSAAGVVSAQTGSGPYQNTYEITTLAGGIHTLTWTTPIGSPVISNATFIVGDNDVVVVDSGLSRSAGEAILEGLRKVTTKPVAMVINTHWHGDHVFGNQAFRQAFPGARFVAHSATRDGIVTGEVGYRDLNRPKLEARLKELRAIATRTEAEDRELARSELQMDAWQGDYVLPDILVDERLTIMQGQRRIDVLHLGHANTPGDVVIHLPAERIVINGDMAITPVQFAFFSSPRAWTGPARQAFHWRLADDAAVGGGTGDGRTPGRPGPRRPEGAGQGRAAGWQRLREGHTGFARPPVPHPGDRERGQGGGSGGQGTAVRGQGTAVSDRISSPRSAALRSPTP